LNACCFAKCDELFRNRVKSRFVNKKKWNILFVYCWIIMHGWFNNLGQIIVGVPKRIVSFYIQWTSSLKTCCNSMAYSYWKFDFEDFKIQDFKFQDSYQVLEKNPRLCLLKMMWNLKNMINNHDRWQIVFCHVSWSKTIKNGQCGFSLIYQFQISNFNYHAKWKKSIGPCGSILEILNMDDWEYKFHKKICYLFSNFQNAILVPCDKKGLVTILVAIFGK
jgi:hypothetical protein